MKAMKGPMKAPKGVGAPPQAMKTMKATVMTASEVYKSAAEAMDMKPKQVKGAVEAVMGVAASELKKNGSFRLAGMLTLRLKKKPAVFKARPASKAVRVIAMKKLKEAVN